MATAERRRNKTQIKIDPPPPLPSPSPASEHGVLLTSVPVLQAELVPLRPAQAALCLSRCEQGLLAALAACCCFSVLQYSVTDVRKSIVTYNSFIHLLHVREPKMGSFKTSQAS